MGTTIMGVAAVSLDFSIAIAHAAGVFYSWFLPAYGDGVDTGSLPGVLVTAASLDRV